jgi:hypothetical protein
MTNHFPQAFKRFPEKYKHFKSFRELSAYFKKEGGTRAPMTDKQTEALAAEAYRMGIKDVNKQDKKGTWRNIATGQKVDDEHQQTKVPLWAKSERRYKDGTITNIETGEKYRIRYSKGQHKGRIMPKSKWTYTNADGVKARIYPPSKKVTKVNKPTKPKNKAGNRRS